MSPSYFEVLLIFCFMALIILGILMMLDIPQERGMSHADIFYPNEDRECQFPLFNFLAPLRAEYMVMVYFIMFLGMNSFDFCVWDGSSFELFLYMFKVQLVLH